MFGRAGPRPEGPLVRSAQQGRSPATPRSEEDIGICILGNLSHFSFFQPAHLMKTCGSLAKQSLVDHLTMVEISLNTTRLLGRDLPAPEEAARLPVDGG